MTRARLALLLALLLAPVVGRAAAAIRNVWIEPAFACPGQTMTVHYEASHGSSPANLMAWGVISQNATLELANDWAFLHNAYTGGTGACPATLLNPINTWDGMAQLDSTSNTTFRPYSAVFCVPAFVSGWGGTMNVILRAAQSYSGTFASAGDQTVVLPVTVDCNKKRVFNQANFWYAESNQVSLDINNSCGGTPTYTKTATRTATPSSTRTATPTLTATPSATPSVTPSSTMTATPSVTATRSATPTSSSTLSATPSSTVTASPTQSSTRTATPSATFSATATLTATDSQTRTSTPTRSSTPTVSFTMTATPSRTATPSATETQSPGPSPTDSMTSTSTPTATPTYTVSFTRTATSTATYTLTATPSLTASPTSTATPSITETSQYTPTSTPSQTLSFTPSQTLTATPSRTATPSFSSTFTPTPTATQSITFSSTATPSGTPTASPSWTATPSYSFTATPTATRTQSYTFTVSPTRTVSPTITETLVPVPYQLSVTLYNAAGERVRVLFEGAAAVLPKEIDLDRSVIRSGIDDVRLDLFGKLSSGGTYLTWRGENDSGQTVSGGAYYFKLEYHDPFGATTSFVKSIQVLEGEPEQHLDLFNSAGELVQRASLNGLSKTAVSFSFDRDQVAVAFDAAGNPLDGVHVTVNFSDGSSQSVPWWGTGLGGQPLASGTYTAVLSGGSDHGTQVSSKSITVIRGLDAGLSWTPYAGPDPAPAQGSPLFGRQLQVRYPAGELLGAQAELYNLAGEKVAESTDWNGTGIVWLSYEGRSTGVYVVSLKGLLRSGAPYRRTLKAAILR